MHYFFHSNLFYKLFCVLYFVFRLTKWKKSFAKYFARSYVAVPMFETIGCIGSLSTVPFSDTL